ncbi:MAG: twin-arginine translocation signal domain-containing protein [Streptosporangiales bacterium]|nr:twin-arginine translocation signal domain-containing protein [Streptosporangiales bacterium]
MNPDKSIVSANWSRRGFLKTSGLVVAALGAAPVLSACSGVKGAGSEGDDDVLAIRTVEDLQNLDPGFMASSTDDAIMVCIAENLVTYVPGKTEPVNELAEKITSSEDGLTHEFTLKKGVQFHGGYGELTAEDVKFSFERIAGLTKPDIESTYQGDWATLKEVEVTGKHTGVIKLSKPFAPLFYTTLPGNAGLIISKAAYDELGEDFATKPVGTGPYEFVEWKRSQHTTLKQFDKWAYPSQKWADKPQWKRIKFVPIPDDSSADVAVESGEVDLGQIAYSSVKRFKKKGDFKVTTLPTLDYAFIGFNVTHPKLRDVKVRKALREALDVDSILEAAFDGETRRAHALISEDVPVGHWKDAPRYQPDAAAAKQQLKDAGVSGLSLEMGIAEEPGAEQVAEIVQQNMKKVGVKVTIKKYPGDQMHEQVKSLQMFYFSFSNQADPSWATVWFTGDQVGDWNFMSWENKEFDRLHDAALVELDPDKRSDMYVRMQELMDEDAIAAWVMYRTNHYAHPREVRTSLIPQRFAKYRAWAVKS